MQALVRFSVTRPKLLVFLLCVATAILATQIGRIHLQLDGRSLVPMDEPALAAGDKAARLFGLKDSVVIGVSPRTGIVCQPATLVVLTKLSSQLSSDEGIVPGSVRSLVNAPGLLFAGGGLSLHELQLGHTITEAQALEVRRALEKAGWNNGILLSKDGRTAAVYADVLPKLNRFELQRRLERLGKQLEQDGQNHVFLTGTALAQATLGEAAATDLLRLIPAVMALLSLVLWACFRQPWPAFLSLAEILMSLLCTLGVMGLMDKSVFVTTLVLPVLLVTVGVADDVYSLRHYYDFRRIHPEANTAEAIVGSFAEVGRHIRLTAILTVAGLLTFALTDIEPLRIFGLFGALALTLSSLATFTLVPAMLMLREATPNVRASEDSRLGQILFLGYLRVGPERILFVTTVALLAAAAVATRVRIDDSWVKNIPAKSAVAEGDRELNQRLGGSLPLELLVSVGAQESFLQPAVFSRLGQLEDTLRRLPAVGAVQSFYTSVAQVEATFATQGYAAGRAAFGTLPKDRQAAVIQHSHAALKAIPEASIAKWLDTSNRNARVMVFLHNADYESIRGVLRAAEGAVPAGTTVTPFGEGGISYQTVELLVEGQKTSIAVAFGTDFLLLWLLLRSWRAGLLALFPVLFSLFAVMAVLALTGTPLGIANSLFVAIALGIGMDFSVHFTASCWEGVRAGHDWQGAVASALEHTASSIVTSVLALTSGFAVLLLSEVAPNAQLGWMICLSLLFCALATLVFTPNLLLVLTRVRVPSASAGIPATYRQPAEE